MTTEELVHTHVLKEYPYWVLSLHTNQNYLGRAVIWCKRENALELPDATDEELRELRDILVEYRKIVRELFNTSWLNFTFLGNIDRHLHGQIIPRYDSPREFAGQQFVDEEWGKHYALEKGIPILEPSPISVAIKDALQKKLNFS